jgi:hypothetical protein
MCLLSNRMTRGAKNATEGCFYRNKDEKRMNEHNLWGMDGAEQRGNEKNIIYEYRAQQ